MIRLITENRLDFWAASNAREAQALTATLVAKLVWASLRSKKEFRFPEGDSIGQRGVDGLLDTEDEFEPFIPQGKSIWEFGAARDAQKKATSDYSKRTKNTDEATRQKSTFIFVTLCGGVSGWDETSQAKWLSKRRKERKWREIKILDGARLVKWIEQFPNIQSWLAERMGLALSGFESVEQYWSVLSSFGKPPPLSPHIFTTNRQLACERFQEVLDNLSNQLQIDTHSSRHLADFAAAYVASLPNDARSSAAGRCIIVTDKDTWRFLAQGKQKHILIANFQLDLEDGGDGSYLIQAARSNNHAVVYATPPGGFSETYRVRLPEPTASQLQEQLEKSGYEAERARRLARKCDGQLHGLLRQIQRLSSRPEWTQSTDAAELVIAEIIGGWDEKQSADIEAIEVLAGKRYWEWIKAIRQATLCPAAPISHRDGKWKFNLRYEGWLELGKHIYDSDLDRLKEIALTILAERDPIFDLEKRDRTVARVKGVSIKHSHHIRMGISETLALLGSFPRALTSSTLGKAEYIANTTVREILTDRDWSVWASLNQELPLLAEAAPNQFLGIIEQAVSHTPDLFISLFKQEDGPIFGQNYTSGLLWALETLAWSPDYLTRVIIALGGLVAIDPGGPWANRAANSIRNILLPWCPQTAASADGRVAAVTALIREHPKCGWESLLKLLPETQSMTVHTHRPAWREFIPNTWTERVPKLEYYGQVVRYAELAVHIAIQEPEKAAHLVFRLDALTPNERERLLTYLESSAFQAADEELRSKLWEALADLIARHKSFADAEWSMPKDLLKRLELILKANEPHEEERRYQPLFRDNEFEPIDTNDSYETSLEKREAVRRAAIKEIFSKGGGEAVIAFAATVQSPWRVGLSLGMLDLDTDRRVLPILLDGLESTLRQFAGGYVLSRFRSRGWKWVDQVDMSDWSTEQKGLFYSYLPFVLETWERVANVLGKKGSIYWSIATANPYEEERSLSTGIAHLLQYGRPAAAIECLAGMLYQNKEIDPSQACSALQLLLEGSDEQKHHESRAISQVIAALQDNPTTKQEDLIRIEWSYLSLLDGTNGPRPKVLEHKIAEAPELFLDLIRLIYRTDQESSETPSEARAVKAVHAYRLLQKWTVIPGTQATGSFNDKAMLKWVDEVKRRSKDSGHFDVALSHLGQVFAHCPDDSNGFWIRESVATLLNARDSDSMRKGFSTQLFNSRGVHWGSKGLEERRLAAEYFEKADAAEQRGYQRLSATVREIGHSYIRYAESEEREARLEE